MRTCCNRKAFRRGSRRRGVGPAAAQAGNALWLAFLLAGLTAGLTAYAYARLARLAPRNSPEFQYTALALLCTWLLLHAGMASIVTALGLSLILLAASWWSAMLTASRRRWIEAVR